MHCVVPENIHDSPVEGIAIFWGWRVGVLQDEKIKIHLWSLFRIYRGVGKGSLRKNPSVGEVWTFSGTTQC